MVQLELDGYEESSPGLEPNSKWLFLKAKNSTREHLWFVLEMEAGMK